MGSKDMFSTIADKEVTPEMRKVQDLIFSHIDNAITEQTKQLNDAVEFACRNLVTPPIKGEITRGKVKWRGLRLKFCTDEMRMSKVGDKMDFICEQRVELWQRDKRIF